MLVTGSMAARWDSFVLAVAVVGLIMISSSSTAVRTSSFVRSSSLSPDMPLDSDVFRVPPGYNAPQQVHITQGDHEGKGVIVSWVTPDEPGSNTVLYWAENSTLKQQAHGIVLTYNYFNYTSNYIHHCTIEDLEFDTKYYYEVGVGNTTRQFSFTTPQGVGPDVPYTFGLIGDLGQTYDSNRTLTHYELNPIKGQTVLFVGDLSYADDYPFHDNNRWDTWGRFIERNAAYQPWIWSYGQQEIMKLILLLNLEIHASIQMAGKGVPKSQQKRDTMAYCCHALSLYNSYVHHYMEGEPMRVLYEPWFVEYKVDVVLAGHVHAYEQSEWMSNIAYNVTNALCSPVSNQSAPVYITIGDGGNQEGLAKEATA